MKISTIPAKVTLALLIVSQVRSGTYLSPSSGFFVPPYTIQDSVAPPGYLQSIWYDLPDILKCFPRFVAGKISSGTESTVLSMTQPANYVANEKAIEEELIKCLGTSGSINSDAAQTFMRKLGNKIIKEDDWRVSGKSLFIMHQMLTSHSINNEIVKELAESYLERYSLLAASVQSRRDRSRGDEHAFQWVQQYLIYLRSLSEMIRRQSAAREVQDFRSLLRLSSGYCASAASLLDLTSAGRLDSISLSHTSKAFFVQLSGSCNNLVQCDVKAHSASLVSMQTSSSASCSLQQESLSEIQRHATEIRNAISHILESATAFQSTVVRDSSNRIVRGSSYRLSSRYSGGRKSSLKTDRAVISFTGDRVDWLESLAEMQCSIRKVETAVAVPATVREYRHRTHSNAIGIGHMYKNRNVIAVSA